MNKVLAFVPVALLLALAPQYAVAQSSSELARANFEAVIDGLNSNTFKKFVDAIDQKALYGEIVGSYFIEPDVRTQVEGTMEEWVPEMYTSTFPPSQDDIIGTVISFESSGGSAQALVRFQGSGYRFAYHRYEMRVGSKGRVSILDWTDFYQGERFSRGAGESFVRAMPTPRASRQLLQNQNVSEGQLFQVGELLKAARDNAHDRYFKIHDAMSEDLRLERTIVRLTLDMARTSNNRQRLISAYDVLTGSFPDEPMFSQKLIEYYIGTGQFDLAIDELEVLQQGLGMVDGATESLKVSAAMALGEMERAEAFALSATEKEPDLELSWWSLLRARTAAGDYAGATEALTQLEERFGHLLIPQKLMRDRFLKVLIDQQEYKDWRAARDQA